MIDKIIPTPSPHLAIDPYFGLSFPELSTFGFRRENRDEKIEIIHCADASKS